MTDNSSLYWAQVDVERFHNATGLAAPDMPTKPDMATALRRASLMVEELEETLAALSMQLVYDRIQERIVLHFFDGEPNQQALADGLTDLIYVTLGTAVECGIDLEPVWQEVHRSNMEKVGPEGVKRRADGKILKPHGWTSPDIDAVMGAPW